MEENALEKEIEAIGAQEPEVRLYVCQHCEEEFDEEYGEIHDEIFICNVCSRHYIVCDECDRFVKDGTQRTATYHSSKVYCESCFQQLHFKCYWCGDWVLCEVESRYEYAHVCGSCFDEYARTCPGCENEFHVDSMTYDGSDEAYYCEECYRDNQSLHEHGYNPNWNPLSTSPSERKLYFGIELEVEVDENRSLNSTAEELLSKFRKDLFYIKHDGSLNHGMEIVTYPMTYEFFKKETKLFEQLLSTLRKWKCLSYETDSCGIHIHISKDEISCLTIYKILKLFYENPGFILKVSQRRLSKFEEWCKLHSKEFRDENNLVLKAKYKNGLARYVAVNLNNEHTIEFRIFRGTIHTPSFIKNVEFIKNVVDFCEATGINNITAMKYLDYVKERRKEFKHLEQFFTNKNLWRREEHVYSNCPDENQDYNQNELRELLEEQS